MEMLKILYAIFLLSVLFGCDIAPSFVQSISPNAAKIEGLSLKKNTLGSREWCYIESLDNKHIVQKFAGVVNGTVNIEPIRIDPGSHNIIANVLSEQFKDQKATFGEIKVVLKPSTVYQLICDSSSNKIVRAWLEDASTGEKVSETYSAKYQYMRTITHDWESQVAILQPLIFRRN